MLVNYSFCYTLYVKDNIITQWCRRFNKEQWGFDCVLNRCVCLQANKTGQHSCETKESWETWLVLFFLKDQFQLSTVVKESNRVSRCQTIKGTTLEMYVRVSVFFSRCTRSYSGLLKQVPFLVYTLSKRITHRCA